MRGIGGRGWSGRQATSMGELFLDGVCMAVSRASTSALSFKGAGDVDLLAMVARRSALIALFPRNRSVVF